jgi:hypothetical protein
MRTWKFVVETRTKAKAIAEEKKKKASGYETIISDVPNGYRVYCRQKEK